MHLINGIKTQFAIMSEDEVMNKLFGMLHNAGLQMISAQHANNQIMFTPNEKDRWLITVTPVKE